MCVCVCEREKERVCVCVRECVREIETAREREGSGLRMLGLAAPEARRELRPFSSCEIAPIQLLSQIKQLLFNYCRRSNSSYSMTDCDHVSDVGPRCPRSLPRAAAPLLLCIVKSFRSRRSFISRPLWTP